MKRSSLWLHQQPLSRMHMVARDPILNPIAAQWACQPARVSEWLGITASLRQWYQMFRKSVLINSDESFKIRCDPMSWAYYMSCRDQQSNTHVRSDELKIQWVWLRWPLNACLLENLKERWGINSRAWKVENKYWRRAKLITSLRKQIH